MLEKYKTYLRDNPRGYWFKRKPFGWGWTPVRWQGWAFLGLWVALLINFFVVMDANSNSSSDTLMGMILPFVLLFLMLLLVGYGTGEKPKWTWGFPGSDDDKEEDKHSSDS